MESSKAKNIAFIGVMAALVFVVLTLETYVFILFISPSPAFLSIPLAISLSIFAKNKMFLGGTILGVCSFILSFKVGLAAFYNPLVSVLPRVIMGIVAYFIFQGLQKLTKDKLTNNKFQKFVKDFLPASVAGGVGVIINTVLVLSTMYLFGGNGSFQTALGTILSFNFVLELVSGLILTPILVKNIQKIN